MKSNKTSRRSTQHEPRGGPVEDHAPTSGDVSASSAAGNQAAQRLLISGIQAKLELGSPDDPLEHEADRVAESIMTDHSVPPSITAAGRSAVARKCAACAEEEEAKQGVVRTKRDGSSADGGGATKAADALRSGGAPLGRSERAFFERRLGSDLSDVRIHVGASVDRGARAIGARAYALGNDIAFRSGQWAPGAPEGRKLLAHELTHVIQQRGGAPPAIRRDPQVAGQTWTVDHADVEGEDPVPHLIEAIAGFTGSSVDVAAAYVNAFIREPHPAARARLYLDAMDFFRDNRHRFAVADPWVVVRKAIFQYLWFRPPDIARDDQFYENLLIVCVYAPGAGEYAIRHTGGDVFHVPGRAAGETDFAPSGTDALARSVGSPRMPLTGGIPGLSTSQLIAGYGAERGGASAEDVSALISAHRGRIWSPLRPALEEVAQDGAIFSVLRQFLEVDGGRFISFRSGFDAHYTHSQPPSIEVEPRIVPDSPTPEQQVNLRATLAHELLHYALDRGDAALTEQGGLEDHALIELLEERVFLLELVRSGLSPVSDELGMLDGWSGGDMKPELRRLIAANDTSGLRRYVRGSNFVNNLVHTAMMSIVSGHRLALGEGGGDFMLDPAQIQDLMYWSAVNARVLQRVLVIAADTADAAGRPLSRIWSHSGFQSRAQAFINLYMSYSAVNREQGAGDMATAAASGADEQ